nr:hypothetical protein [Flavobacterium sp.]
MKTEDINVLIKEFASIESITPSENWDLVFQNKLYSARLSKSNTMLKINVLMIVLVCLNIGVVWGIIANHSSTVAENRSSNLVIISNELLTNSNN